MLQQLMLQMGFQDAQIHPHARTRRLPAVAEFVLRHLAATPVADAVEALSRSGRAALAEEVSTVLRPYADAGGIAYPDAVNVVTAVR